MTHAADDNATISPEGGRTPSTPATEQQQRTEPPPAAPPPSAAAAAARQQPPPAAAVTVPAAPALSFKACPAQTTQTKNTKNKKTNKKKNKNNDKKEKKETKEKSMDSRLSPVKGLTESQPSAVQSSVSTLAAKMLSAEQKIVQMQAGVLRLTARDDEFPSRCNFKSNCPLPEDLKNDPAVQDLEYEHTTTLNNMKKKLKAVVIQEKEYIVKHENTKRSEYFAQELLKISGLCAAFHKRHLGATGVCYKDDEYGAIAMHCFLQGLPDDHHLFSNTLKVSKTEMVEGLSSKSAISENGCDLLCEQQYEYLKAKIEDPTSDLALPSSEKASVANEDIGCTQTSVQEDWMAQQDQGLKEGAVDLILAIHTSLRTVIPPIFSDLFDTLRAQKLLEKANRETSSKLKKQQTIDLAAETETGAATLPPVTQANMEEVVFGLTDKKKAKDKKEEQKAARKKSSGGEQEAKKKGKRKQQPGEKSKDKSKNDTAPPKQPKNK